ncbi:MAG: PhoPQ-activated pathogenicity-related family protein [Candidatus Omnitrophica bacterium]|nr:PhoPQ-activated pathogenicity-related family protein [Candidatus Omnitrophota bacterium]
MNSRFPRYFLFVMITAAFLFNYVAAWGEPKWHASMPGMERTTLDRYVAAPDPNYHYELVNTIQGQGYTAYVIDMISQCWRSSEEVDRTLWQHWMTIIKPDAVKSSTGLLFIGGGSNGKPAPDKVDKTFVKIALSTNSVLTVLTMIPNQPLKFSDEWMDQYKEKGRVEDALIAYTWNKYLKTGDEYWPARLPMVKSVVRAMDTVTLFLGSDQGGNIKQDSFVLAGGSKRGWTTWMTAAVDPRVSAIIPIVIDMLNLKESFEHHWKVYGFWAPAIGNYVEMDLMKHLGEPKFQALMKIVEPYEYRARFTMPKYMINASGDQFFIPDSSQFYYDDLPGVKHIRYVPNADHGLDDSDAVESLTAFYHAILNHIPLPQYSWKIEESGVIRLQTETTPHAVKLWQATNPTARDFRLETIDKAWTSADLKESEDGVYLAEVEKPQQGWTAYFIEMTYPSGIQVPFKFTTGVKVIPDEYPYDYPPEPTE